MVQFEALEAVALLAWIHWAAYKITHQSPWGHWTPDEVVWYMRKRRRLGVGYTPATYGTMWLVMYPTIALAYAWYTTGYSCGNTGTYASTVVLGISALAVEKVWRALMWDYRDGASAFWVILGLQIPLWIATMVLAAVSPVCPAQPEDHWVRWFLIAIVAVFMLDAFYHLNMMWEWANDNGDGDTKEYPLFEGGSGKK